MAGTASGSSTAPWIHTGIHWIPLDVPIPKHGTHFSSFKSYLIRSSSVPETAQVFVRSFAVVYATAVQSDGNLVVNTNRGHPADSFVISEVILKYLEHI